MDDLINNVFIPYINETSFNYHNLSNILYLVYKVLLKGLYTCKTNIMLLIITLVKRMKRIRKGNPQYPRIKVAKEILYTMSILKTLFYIPHWLVINTKQQLEMLKAIENYVEPYDRINLGPLWNVKPSILDVIQEYDKQCSIFHHEFCKDPKMKKYALSFQLDQEAYIRYILLYTCENVNNFAIEITTIFWSHFGWADPFEAYENMLRIISETAQFAFLFNFMFPSDTFIILLYESVIYSYNFIKKYHCNIQKINRILLKAIRSVHLQAIIEPHYIPYRNLLLKITDMCLKLNSNSNYFKRMINLFEKHLKKIIASPDLHQSNMVDRQQNMRFVNDFLDDEYLKKRHWIIEKREIINIFHAYNFMHECMETYNTKLSDSAESDFLQRELLSKRNQMSLKICEK